MLPDVQALLNLVNQLAVVAWASTERAISYSLISCFGPLRWLVISRIPRDIDLATKLPHWSFWASAAFPPHPRPAEKPGDWGESRQCGLFLRLDQQARDRWRHGFHPDSQPPFDKLFFGQSGAHHAPARKSSWDAVLVDRLSRSSSTSPQDRRLLASFPGLVLPECLLQWLNHTGEDWSLAKKLLNSVSREIL